MTKYLWNLIVDDDLVHDHVISTFGCSCQLLGLGIWTFLSDRRDLLTLILNGHGLLTLMSVNGLGPLTSIGEAGCCWMFQRNDFVRNPWKNVWNLRGGRRVRVWFLAPDLDLAFAHVFPLWM